MATTRRDRNPPTLALTIEEACQALGCSWDCWKDHISRHIEVLLTQSHTSGVRSVRIVEAG